MRKIKIRSSENSELTNNIRVCINLAKNQNEGGYEDLIKDLQRHLQDAFICAKLLPMR